MDVLILGVNTASPGGCSTSSDARCEAGMLLKGPWDDPKPLAAAPFRLTGSYPIRIAQGLILGLLGRRGRDEDLPVGTRAARVRY